jgi:hypothetical protein
LLFSEASVDEDGFFAAGDQKSSASGRSRLAGVTTQYEEL